MTDMLASPAVEALAQYAILPESTRTHIRFAQTAEPQPFQCQMCGLTYHSVWVGIHCVRGRCGACNEKMRQGVARSSQPEIYPMPPMYARDGSALLPAVRSWMRRPLPALALLHGGPGRGKSAQGHHIAKHCFDAGATWRMIGDRDLMRLTDEALNELAGVSMLIVDEIGRRTTENVMASVCELIDRRVPYDRKTVIVSNLTGEDLALMDARLISRIKAAERIAFMGPDLRKAVTL
jgi:hypothetical protein